MWREWRSVRRDGICIWLVGFPIRSGETGWAMEISRVEISAVTSWEGGDYSLVIIVDIVAWLDFVKEWANIPKRAWTDEISE